MGDLFWVTVVILAFWKLLDLFLEFCRGED